MADANMKHNGSGDDKFQKRGGQVMVPKAPPPPTPANKRPTPPPQSKK